MRCKLFADHPYARDLPVKEAALAVKDRALVRLQDHQESKEEQINSDNRTALLSAIYSATSYSEIIEAVFRTAQLRKAVEGAILADVNSVVVHLCSKTLEPGPSVLRTMADTKSLQEEDVFSSAVLELKKNMPFVLDMLVTLCSPTCMTSAEKNDTLYTVAMIYGMVMYNRNPHLCALQKLNTAVAVRMHANNELLSLFHKSSITLSEGSKLHFLEQLGTFNMDGVVRSIQQGKPGKLTIDNVDGMLMASEIRLGSGNKHYHYTACTYYPDRVDVSQLSMAQRPIQQIIDPSVFFLTAEEERTLKLSYGYQVCTKIDSGHHSFMLTM